MWSIVTSLFLIPHLTMYSVGLSYIGVVYNVSLVMSYTNSTFMNGTCNECLCAAVLNNTTSISSFNCFHNNNTCEMFTLSLNNGSYTMVPNQQSSFYLFPLLTYETVSTTVSVAQSTSHSLASIAMSFTSTTMTTSMITTTGATTTATANTTKITTTTSAPCPTGYVRIPAGTCVNLLIDFNNCGTIGYVCASSYTSCSNGACSGAPAVQLVGGVSVSGWGGAFSVDDSYTSVTAPFAISMYGYSTTSPSIQSNGCVCLGGCNSTYSNTALSSSSFSGPTAFGYWDDLYIYSGTSQTVYYGTTGTYPSRSLVFEFYTAHYGAPTQYYRFQIVFYENAPNIVRYYYYQASDGGASATIGVQNQGGTLYSQYSYNSGTAVPTGSSNTSVATLILTFNTTSNTYTSAAG